MEVRGAHVDGDGVGCGGRPRRCERLVRGAGALRLGDATDADASGVDAMDAQPVVRCLGAIGKRGVINFWVRPGSKYEHFCLQEARLLEGAAEKHVSGRTNDFALRRNSGMFVMFYILGSSQ